MISKHDVPKFLATHKKKIQFRILYCLRFKENLLFRQHKIIQYRYAKEPLIVCYHSGWWDGVSIRLGNEKTVGRFQSWKFPGTWEEATLRVFDQEITRDTDLYIGFGAWIGPTALFAATVYSHNNVIYL